MTLWGFFHNPCVYESGAGLVSLHRTKAGAWRAKQACTVKLWLQVRNAPTGLHMGKGFWRQHMASNPLEHQATHVAPVTVTE